MNERLRILKLLEDGKINADEAARLLEALSQPETKGRRRHKILHSVEKIPEIVTLVTDHVFKHTFEKQEMHYDKKKKIELKGISGTFGIKGSETETVDIDKDGFAKIVETDDTLMIKAIHGDMQLHVPTLIDLTIKNVSGNVDICDVEGAIHLASVSGNICGYNLAGSLKADFVSGNIELDYMSVSNMKITSKYGNITLHLNEDIGAEIEVDTEDGNIVCEFDLMNEEKTETKLRGTLNKSTAKIYIRNEHGNTAIKRRIVDG